MVLGLVTNETVSGAVHTATYVTFKTLWYVVVCVSHMALQRPSPWEPLVAQRAVGRPILSPAPIWRRCFCNHNTGGWVKVSLPVAAAAHTNFICIFFNFKKKSRFVCKKIYTQGCLLETILTIENGYCLSNSHWTIHWWYDFWLNKLLDSLKTTWTNRTIGFPKIKNRTQHTKQ